MGAADIVPGISGGSMALILGFYEEFIFAVRSLASKEIFSLFTFQFKTFSKYVSWDFLLALVIGIIFSLGTLSQGIQIVLGDEVFRIYLYSLFIGMIFASVIICRRHIKLWNNRYLWGVGFGAMITFFLTGVRVEPTSNGPLFDVVVHAEEVNNGEGKEIRNYDEKTQMLSNVSESQLSGMLAKDFVQKDTIAYNQKTHRTGYVGDFVKPQEPILIQPWLICCGMIAINAMLLPGISGSYLLVILGAYPLVIGALADFTKGLEFDAFVILANVAVGIVIGALLFSRVIAWLLRHYHTATLTLLIGFMIGGLRTLWPFWSYEYILNPLKLEKGPQLELFEPYIPSVFMPTLWFAILAAIVGAILVFSLEKFATHSGQQ
ncbi:MAG: hypothetical protein K940chlam7_02035 [Chlamydiae bacterium]|nr:hypothetical protein [Chlamydiota bacterium]